MEAGTATRGGSLLDRRFGIARRGSTVRVFAMYYASDWLSARVF